MTSASSLENLPVCGRFEDRRDVLKALYVQPVSWECDPPGTFNAKCDGRCLGTLRLGKAAMTRVRINQTPDQIEHPQAGLLKLTLPLSGVITVSQDNKQTIVRPGQFFLVDPSRPFHEHIVEDLTFHWIHVPGNVVTSRVGRIEEVTATAFSNESPYGRLSIDFIQSVSRILDLVSRPAAANISAMALDLFTMALWEQTGKLQRHNTTHRSGLGHRAKAFIDDHLSDPDLSLGAVAKALRISTRYVRDLLADGGIVYREYVLDQRLARCARDLVNPRMESRSITHTAFSWGFDDSAHFSRAFKAAYGMSPREYRASRKPLRVEMESI